jgi:hypothetical protein
MNTNTSRPIFALALTLGLLGASFGLAQTPAPDQTNQDHSGHHPKANAEAPTPVPVTPGPASQQPDGMPMGMMGDMRQMMSMCNKMMSAQHVAMASDIERRIDSLKTELKITDAQAPQWTRFTNALRGAAKSMEGMDQMMQSNMALTLPARLERQGEMLSTHLSAVKALKEAAQPLYESFSEEQKKIADAQKIGPMGPM